MEITDVRITSFRPPLPDEAAKKLVVKGQSIAPYMSDFLLVQVVTDEGVTGEVVSGYGGLSLGYSIAERLRPFLIGRDPAHREAIWQDLWELDRLLYTTQFAIGTVDVALWDVYAKSLDVPLYQLLGAYRDRVPVYASGQTFATPEEFAEDALQYKDRGFTAYKLHVKGEPRFDVEVCTAVREAAGDDFVLMSDVAGGYTQTEALRVGRALEELDYHWYEEPLRDTDLHGYRMLNDKLDIPIAGVEVIGGGMYTTPEYITSRALDIVRSDVSFKGGIGQVRKTAALAEAFGLNIEIHTNANAVMDAANLQVIASIKNTEYFELLVPEEYTHRGAVEPIRIEDGMAILPDRPGIGVEVDWELVDRYRVQDL